jgi:NAD(P)-dependent dehydrogenase (short-subunit alcohol dehydrogenase family)
MNNMNNLIKDTGCTFNPVSVDLSASDSCQKLLEFHKSKFGNAGLDVLVLNHAYQGKAVTSFKEFTSERIEQTFKTNILSFFNIVRDALPFMNEGSSIITLSSVQGYDPSWEILDYACTKAAIVAFTQGLAAHPEVVKKGIRVNTIAPVRLAFSVFLALSFELFA